MLNRPSRGDAVVKFEIDKETHDKINKWLHEEVFPEAIKKQKEYYKQPSLFERLRGKVQSYPHSVMVDSWELGYPYGGAIGGGTVYSFSPTSLGVVLEVESWGMKKNFTDYENW